MGHVTNGLTLAFNHLVWAKRRHKRRETGRVRVRRPCWNSTSQRKWIKKISEAIYSEQTSDKTWQGQREKEQSLDVVILKTPRPGSRDPSDGKALKIPSRFFSLALAVLGASSDCTCRYSKSKLMYYWHHQG